MLTADHCLYVSDKLAVAHSVVVGDLLRMKDDNAVLVLSTRIARSNGLS
jgi:hypothetical protein